MTQVSGPQLQLDPPFSFSPMNLLDVMTRGLLRGDTNDFAVVAGRAPCVKVGKEYNRSPIRSPPRRRARDARRSGRISLHRQARDPNPSVWRANEDSLGPCILPLRAVRACCRREWSDSRSAVQAAARPPAAPVAPAAQLRPPCRQPVARPARRSRNAGDPHYETPAATPVAKRSSAPPRESILVRVLVRSALRELACQARAMGRAIYISLRRARPFTASRAIGPFGPALGTARCGRHGLGSVPPRLLGELEKDGSCDFALEHAHGRFRVNVSRQRTGLKASLRLIGAEVPTLASLGLPDAIGNATHHHQGLIVVTGPTGSRQDEHARGDRRHAQHRRRRTTSSPSKIPSSTSTLARRR